MPALRRSDDVAGTLCEKAANLLGLPAGIPVSAGGGDGAAATLGAGLFSEEGAYCNIGSSAWVAGLSKRPVIDEGMRVLNYASMDGAHFTVCATVQSGAAALQWAAQNMILAGRPFDKDTILEMEALARASVPGARGVFFLPTLVGERTPWWDPYARGTMIGVSLHHTRADIARAAYEGVCEAMLLCGDVLRENRLPIDRLVLVGGGAGSNIWPQMFADLFGAPVAVHCSPRNATALGAAMAAGVGVGLFQDYQEASNMARAGEAVFPNEPDRAQYLAHYVVYQTLYGDLRGAYRRIYGYQNRS
jgi:xylulokinase